jgi:hypothetical protein
MINDQRGRPAAPSGDAMLETLPYWFWVGFGLFGVASEQKALIEELLQDHLQNTTNQEPWNGWLPLR